MHLVYIIKIRTCTETYKYMIANGNLPFATLFYFVCFFVFWQRGS